MSAASQQAKRDKIATVNAHCAHCGKLFKKRMSRANPYCSHPCSAAAKTKRFLSKFPDRFWSNVTRADDCWIWKGPFSPKRYGVVHVPGKHVPQRTNRVAWILANHLDIPEGFIVRHACDNPSCVNPAHLLLGTHRDNMRDMAQRKRAASGDRNAMTRPDIAAKVWEARRASQNKIKAAK